MTDDPWEDGRANADHLTHCTRDNCDRCDHLCDGFYMACDNCGSWGHQDSDGWYRRWGMVFCNERCADAYGKGSAALDNLNK